MHVPPNTATHSSLDFLWLCNSNPLTFITTRSPRTSRIFHSLECARAVPQFPRGHPNFFRKPDCFYQAGQQVLAVSHTAPLSFPPVGLPISPQPACGWGTFCSLSPSCFPNLSLSPGTSDTSWEVPHCWAPSLASGRKKVDSVGD